MPGRFYFLRRALVLRRCSELSEHIPVFSARIQIYSGYRLKYQSSTLHQVITCPGAQCAGYKNNKGFKLKQAARNIVLKIQLVLPLLALLSLSFTPMHVFAETNPQDFNHAQTGYPLTGAHLNLDCVTCHVGEIFKGTPRNCSGCHARGSRVVATPMPADHFVTSDPCELCHTSTVTFLGARFNHVNALPGACTTCHNGRQAAGKPSNHNSGPQMAFSCEKCHRTYAWVPALFDHTGIAPGSCAAQCHNGTFATGRPANHATTLKANSTCDTCHRVSAWFPTFYNHTAIVPGSCSTCHNGTTATGRPANHSGAKVLMTCDQCHNTIAWLPGTYNHIGTVPGSCLNCHAAQRPTSHAARGYIASCDACHSIGPQWTFNHAMQQGRHTCNSCHSKHHDSTPCDNCHTVNHW